MCSKSPHSASIIETNALTIPCVGTGPREQRPILPIRTRTESSKLRKAQTGASDDPPSLIAPKLTDQFLCSQLFWAIDFRLSINPYMPCPQGIES